MKIIGEYGLKNKREARPLTILFVLKWVRTLASMTCQPTSVVSPQVKQTYFGFWAIEVMEASCGVHPINSLRM